MEQAPEPVQRQERKPVSLRGVLSREDGPAMDVTVLDLSYDGCGLECSETLRVGERVKLLVRGGTIGAEVRWSASGKAGVAFEPEPAPRQQVPRQAQRVPLSAEIPLKLLGKTNYRVRIFDLSPEGCKAELIDSAKLGDQVLMRFPDLEPLQAEICWFENHVAGLRFMRPFHPAVFDLVVAKLGDSGAR